jgi:hypothetical protein
VERGEIGVPLTGVDLRDMLGLKIEQRSFLLNGSTILQILSVLRWSTMSMY